MMMFILILKNCSRAASSIKVKKICPFGPFGPFAMASFTLYKFLLILSLLIICHGHATEYQPWLGNFYEFEWRSSLMYQGYTRLSSDEHLKKYSSSDVFLNVSLSNAHPTYSAGVELELTQARTRRQRGDLDQIKLTGRYVWQDDVAGDPLSLTTGLSYTQAFRHSLKDVSSFHHGLNNAEFFISIGKEKPDERLWGSRWWGMCILGIAEQGSPWLRFYLDYEKRLKEKHEIGLFLNSLWGFGHQKLRLHHFHGYGPVQHRSVDLGLRYTYLLEFYGSASFEYSYRIYAHNFPIYAHRVLAQILYTFGL